MIMSGVLEPRLCENCADAARGADYDGPELVLQHFQEKTSPFLPATSHFRDPTQDVPRREGPLKEELTRESVAGSE